MLDFFNVQHIMMIPSILVYSLLLIICVLEGLPIVGSIVAGGSIVIAVGTVSQVSSIDPFVSIGIATAGSLIGDLGGFYILRKYGHKIKFLKKLIDGVRDNEGKLSDLFDRRYFVITIVARLIPFVRSAPSLVAAIRAINARGYVVASFLSSALWATLGVAAGYGLSSIIDVKYILSVLITVVAITTLLGLSRHLIRSRKVAI